MKQSTAKLSIKAIFDLFRPRFDAESATKSILIIVGILLTPFTLLGALWFYVRSFNRHLRPYGEKPDLGNIPAITKVSMAIGGGVIWIVLWFARRVMKVVVDEIFGKSEFLAGYKMAYTLICVALTFFIVYRFNQWRMKTWMNMQRDETVGSAKMGTREEYLDLVYNPYGIYVGDIDMKFADQGHIITVAGPASGKFTNFIASNLLGTSNYTGSWFVIDVKGEAFSVTEEYQKSTGRQVIVLNPWNLIKNSDATYNPLDLINVNDEESLVDDASIIAQMIVPSEKGDHDPYWRNRARSFITGLIIHLLLQKDTVKDGAVIEKAAEKTLTTIWKWLRLQEKDFIKLLTKMSLNQNEVASGAANELISIQGSDKAYSSILSAAQDATDFLKSPSLQRSLKTSNFNINELSNGNTCLYVVIPADKLESQSQWLRLIVATSLLSVVRNKDKQVTFVLDEFAALGHMEIVQRYMGLARGYNVSLWPILQSLQQLKSIYGDGWETFIGASAVRLYFGISDNFSADYISHAFGVSTFQSDYYEVNKGPERHQRPLVTPDEVKRFSGDNVFIQVNQRNPYLFPKVPYYLDPELVERASENPYSPYLLKDPKLMKRFIKLPRDSKITKE